MSAAIDTQVNIQRAKYTIASLNDVEMIDGAIDIINRFTNNFDASFKIDTIYNSESIKEKMIATLNSGSFPCYGRLDASTNLFVNCKVNGVGGCYIYKTIKDKNVYFIWHNRVDNKYEIWGELENVYKTINELNYRMNRFTKQNNEKLKAESENENESSSNLPLFENNKINVVKSPNKKWRKSPIKKNKKIDDESKTPTLTTKTVPSIESVDSGKASYASLLKSTN
jgi:hypothetical protein